MPSYRDKLKSINVGLPRRRQPKVTQINEHGSTRTEHWEDRMDVNIRPQTIVWAPNKKAKA